MFAALALLFACAHGPTAADGEVAEDAAASAAPEAEQEGTIAVTSELDEDQLVIADAEDDAGDGDEDMTERERSARAEHSEHADHAAEFGDMPRPSKPAPACGEGGARVASSLGAAMANASASGDLLKVVLTLAEGADVPALLQEPLPAGQLVQGWVDAAKLCDLAATEGVQSIREPIEASPK